MLLRNNVGCRVFAELAYTTQNEMSYGNCKPNVLAKTVTVMTAVCRKVTVLPLVKCIRRMKRKVLHWHAFGHQWRTVLDYRWLQWINNLAYVGEYFLKHTVALHVVVKPLCLVPVDEGSGLGVIYCKSGTGDTDLSPVPPCCLTACK